jgi:hypothetical protein
VWIQVRIVRPLLVRVWIDWRRWCAHVASGFLCLNVNMNTNYAPVRVRHSQIFSINAVISHKKQYIEGHKNTISGPEISVRNTRTEMPSRGAKQAEIPRCISVWAISVTSLPKSTNYSPNNTLNGSSTIVAQQECAQVLNTAQTMNYEVYSRVLFFIFKYF